MMPPTSIDGTDITGATIDGQDVQEITVDGQTVFSAGPGDPPDLVNLDLHYAARLETAYSNNDTVTTFNDQNGSFNASIAGGDPTFKTNQINGLPAVEYDGNDAHDTGHVQNTSDDLSFYAVIDIGPSYQASDTLFFGRFDGTRYSYGIKTDGALRFSYGDTPLGPGSAGDIPTGASLNTAIFDGSTGTAFVDGVQKLTGSYTPAGGSGTDHIGARGKSTGFDEEFDGQIAEILTYSVAHSSATQQSVETYLQNIYGL
jgi:hypothetical protein